MVVDDVTVVMLWPKLLNAVVRPPRHRNVAAAAAAVDADGSFVDEHSVMGEDDVVNYLWLLDATIDLSVVPTRYRRHYLHRLRIKLKKFCQKTCNEIGHKVRRSIEVFCFFSSKN